MTIEYSRAFEQDRFARFLRAMAEASFGAPWTVIVRDEDGQTLVTAPVVRHGNRAIAVATVDRGGRYHSSALAIGVQEIPLDLRVNWLSFECGWTFQVILDEDTSKALLGLLPAMPGSQPEPDPKPETWRDRAIRDPIF